MEVMTYPILLARVGEQMADAETGVVESMESLRDDGNWLIAIVSFVFVIKSEASNSDNNIN